MIDVSGIEYDFLPSVLWVVGIVLVGAVLFGVGLYKDHAGFGVPGLILTLGGLVFGSTLIIVTPANTYVASERHQVIKEQLSDQGFSRVDLNWSDKTFTASVDGEYFEGLLHPIGDYKYQVLEVGEVKP